MRITHDLKCGDEHVEHDVLYDPEQGVPECLCGLPRKVCYTIRGQGATGLIDAASLPGVFHPIKCGDITFTTQESWDTYRANYAAKHKTTPDKLEIHSVGSPAERKVVREELRHTAYTIRRAQGFDEQTHQSYIKEQRAQKAAAQNRR